MNNLQRLFDTLKEKQQQLKSLKKMIGEECMRDSSFAELHQTQQETRKQMKNIQKVILSQTPDTVAKIEDLRIEIDTLKTEITDVVLSKIGKNESIEVNDGAQLCLPIFSVSFKVQ